MKKDVLEVENKNAYAFTFMSFDSKTGTVMQELTINVPNKIGGDIETKQGLGTR